MNWKDRKVVVTGGAGFIGSNLVDSLLSKGANVLVVDKLLLYDSDDDWISRMNQLNKIYSKNNRRVRLVSTDLVNDAKNFELLLKECNIDTVFHLAAVFGGREFVNTRQVDCAKMLTVDSNVFRAALEAGVERVHYTSSACVYPDSLQYKGSAPLIENNVLQEYDRIHSDWWPTSKWWTLSDNLYGWAKLMGELQCKVYHEEKGMKTSTCRYLTVYGPGEMDTSHAIPALIERALDKSEPFTIWGDGRQERGFTYVDDIVKGSILAAELVEDGTPINLGTDERYNIRQVCDMIFENIQWTPKKVQYDISKPEGPRSRGLNVNRAKDKLGWWPEVHLREGLQKTVSWHMNKRKESVIA